MSQINAAEQLAEGKRIEARKRMIRFAGMMQPTYKWNWMHEKVANAIDDFIAGRIKRLMLFVPPQHGKSELVSRLLSPLALGVNPKEKILLASYASSLAESMNRDMQNFMGSDAYRELFPNIGLPKTGTGGIAVCNAERFDVIYRGGKQDGKRTGGSVQIAGVSGGLTGKPADKIIIDDPHKDREDARNLNHKVWEWYTGVVRTRCHNDTGILIVQTRWDVNDLAGRLLNNMHEAIKSGDENADMWTVICFPAIKENDGNPDDPRAVGEALWPERHNLKSLLSKRSESEGNFQSLYQQNPMPTQAGGECYKMFDIKTNTGDYTYDPELPLHFSFDFNVNPYMTCTVWQVHTDIVGNKIAYQIEEINLRSPQNTTQGICAYIRTKYGSRHLSTSYIYGDPNGMKRIRAPRRGIMIIISSERGLRG